MSARIAPEAVPMLPVVEYRPPAPAAVPIVDPAPEARQAYANMGKAEGSVSGEFEGLVEAERPGPVIPEPPAEPSGASYVRAVISGALSPRPTTAAELFMRVGTGWVPPESEFRLTDKTI